MSVAVIGAITAGMTEGIFELMLRYPSHVPRSMLEVLKEYYYEEDQAFIQYLPDCSKYDDELTYTLRPGSCRFIGREFDTVVNANSLGVRDDENSLHSPQIIFLGDSIAMGWGVNDEDTFAQRIEKGTGSTVLNLAVSSYGTVREFKIAQRVDITRLVTIIVQYSSNDFDENQKFFELGNTLPISSEKHYETSQREHLKQVGYYVGKHTTWILKHATWILKQLYYSTNPHFSQRDYIEGGKRRGYFHLDDPGGSALLSRRQRRNWTPIAAIRLCTSQCPIRRRSDSLVADSADNPQIARLNHRLQFVGAGPTPVGIA